MFKPYERQVMRVRELAKTCWNLSAILHLIEVCGGCDILPTINVSTKQLAPHAFNISNDKNYILLEHGIFRTISIFFPYNQNSGYVVGENINKDFANILIGDSYIASRFYVGLGSYTLSPLNKYTLIELPNVNVFNRCIGVH